MVIPEIVVVAYETSLTHYPTHVNSTIHLVVELTPPSKAYILLAAYALTTKSDLKPDVKYILSHLKEWRCRPFQRNQSNSMIYV